MRAFGGTHPSICFWVVQRSVIPSNILKFPCSFYKELLQAVSADWFAWLCLQKNWGISTCQAPVLSSGKFDCSVVTCWEKIFQFALIMRQLDRNTTCCKAYSVIIQLDEFLYFCWTYCIGCHCLGPSHITMHFTIVLSVLNVVFCCLASI